MSFSGAFRRQLTAHRLAQAAILLELVVVARTLGEIYRLRTADGPAFTLDQAMIWVTGSLMALAFLALSTILYFARRERLAAFAAVAMIALLITYKAMTVGLG